MMFERRQFLAAAAALGVAPRGTAEESELKLELLRWEAMTEYVRLDFRFVHCTPARSADARLRFSHGCPWCGGVNSLKVHIDLALHRAFWSDGSWSDGPLLNHRPTRGTADVRCVKCGFEDTQ